MGPLNGVQALHSTYDDCTYNCARIADSLYPDGVLLTSPINIRLFYEAMLRTLRVSLNPYLVVRKTNAYRFVTCWKCGTEVAHVDFFCNNSPCGVVQAFKLSEVNAFHIFHLEQKYFIDVNVLDMEYKNIQKLLHPDMFVTKPPEEREASLQASSTINQAYQVEISQLDDTTY